MVYSHDSFIANSKTFSIVITIINSKTFSDSVAWFYIDCERLCMGIYFIAIYYRHSLDFIIGYFKTSISSIAWFYIDYESLCAGTSLYDSTPL